MRPVDGKRPLTLDDLWVSVCSIVIILWLCGCTTPAPVHSGRTFQRPKPPVYGCAPTHQKPVFVTSGTCI